MFDALLVIPSLPLIIIIVIILVLLLPPRLISWAALHRGLCLLKRLHSLLVFPFPFCFLLFIIFFFFFSFFCFFCFFIFIAFQVKLD